MIRAKYAIASSPARNVVAGSSMGGLAAAFVANRHPELFGNVLSQSGAFMFGAPGEQAGERMKREVESAPKRDVAYYLEAGIYEVDRLENGVDLLTSNQHLRDALNTKGYRLTYERVRRWAQRPQLAERVLEGVDRARREIAGPRSALRPDHDPAAFADVVHHRRSIKVSSPARLHLDRADLARGAPRRSVAGLSGIERSHHR